MRVFYDTVGTTGQVNAYNYATSTAANLALQSNGGNVGIGTTSPLTFVHLRDPITSWGTELLLDATPVAGGLMWDIQSSGGNAGEGQGKFLINGQSGNAFTIDSNRNVGIGTTAPAGKLDVEGSGGVILNAGNVGIGTTSPHINLEVLADNGANIAAGLKITNAHTGGSSFYLAATDAIDSWGANSFVLANGSTSTPLVVVKGTGNVGIGTTAPASALEISLPNSSSQRSILQFSSDSPVANTMVTSLRWVRSAYDPTGVGASIDFWRGSNGEKGAIAFSTNPGGTTGQLATERMRITEAGYVGIGTTSPAYALDVTGDTRTTGCFKTGAAGTLLGGTCASDARFKHHVTPITDALSRVSLLRPVHYRYRTEEFPGRGFGTGMESGFIAQELQSVYPELVVADDDGYLKVRYGLDLQMETIAALKELKIEKDADIAQLKANSVAKDAVILQLRADAEQLKARADKAEADAAQLKSFLCGQFPNAPMCQP